MKYDVQAVTFSAQMDAENVLSNMREVLECYDRVSVADLYDLIGHEVGARDDKLGWYSLDDSYVIRICGDAWKIVLPPVVELESSKPKEEDMVNHPTHYISGNGIEVIDVIEAFTESLVGIEATDTGNVIKYICRWSHKNGIQDLEKAKWYLEHLINHIKTEKEN